LGDVDRMDITHKTRVPE